MTVFLWRPRVGQLSAIKDDSVTEYYYHAIEVRKMELPESPPMFDNIPTIMGSFNDWKPTKMRKMVEFLKANDP